MSAYYINKEQEIKGKTVKYSFVLWGKILKQKKVQTQNFM